MSDAAWKAANYNSGITVDQSQIDTLNSRGTPQGNFDYYKQNGANAMEVESLNRFYGKDAVAAAGVSVRPNVPHGASVVPPDRAQDPARVVPANPPSWHGQSPFGPSTPRPTPTPGYVGPGARGQSPFGPSTPRPTPAPRPAVPGFRGSSPNPLRPAPAAPTTQPPRANTREGRSSTVSA